MLKRNIEARIEVQYTIMHTIIIPTLMKQDAH